LRRNALRDHRPLVLYMPPIRPQYLQGAVWTVGRLTVGNVPVNTLNVAPQARPLVLLSSPS
jgi:hypothetical protein